MLTLRCTQKLRKEMGLHPNDLQDDIADKSLLGDWYAHLFFQDRKKCVIFVAERTLLSFLATALPRERIRKLDEVFREGLFRLLLEEGFQAEHATPVFDQCQQVEYAATTDRSMIGTVNELVKEVQFWLPRLGGVVRPDLPTLHHKLNRNPLKRIEYDFAIDRTREVLRDAISC